MVELLLAAGANPNALDIGDNASPLHYASERGHLKIVERLVDAGADVNYNQDLHQRGPLGWQVFFGNVETARLALSLGARVDPDWIVLTADGAAGKLRAWSYGAPESFRAIAALLKERLENPA